MKHAQEHHQSQRVKAMAQEAATLLRRSKQKDYYKILNVQRDADEREIKKAYRKLSKEFHPDKAVSRGVPKEESEKKMAAINEAYETLKDPELRARVDRGDDPNDPSQQQGGQPFHGSPFGNQHQFMFKQGSGADGHFNFHFGGFG
jgi:DnaJ family protein C protein 3